MAEALKVLNSPGTLFVLAFITHPKRTKLAVALVGGAYVVPDDTVSSEQYDWDWPRQLRSPCTSQRNHDVGREGQDVGREGQDAGGVGDEVGVYVRGRWLSLHGENKNEQ